MSTRTVSRMLYGVPSDHRVGLDHRVNKALWVLRVHLVLGVMWAQRVRLVPVDPTALRVPRVRTAHRGLQVLKVRWDPAVSRVTSDPAVSRVTSDPVEYRANGAQRVSRVQMVPVDPWVRMVCVVPRGLVVQWGPRVMWAQSDQQAHEGLLVLGVMWVFKVHSVLKARAA